MAFSKLKKYGEPIAGIILGAFFSKIGFDILRTGGFKANELKFGDYFVSYGEHSDIFGYVLIVVGLCIIIYTSYWAYTLNKKEKNSN